MSSNVTSQNTGSATFLHRIIDTFPQLISSGVICPSQTYREASTDFIQPFALKALVM